MCSNNRKMSLKAFSFSSEVNYSITVSLCNVDVDDGVHTVGCPNMVQSDDDAKWAVSHWFTLNWFYGVIHVFASRSSSLKDFFSPPVPVDVTECISNWDWVIWHDCLLGRSWVKAFAWREELQFSLSGLISSLLVSCRRPPNTDAFCVQGVTLEPLISFLSWLKRNVENRLGWSAESKCI